MKKTLGNILIGIAYICIATLGVVYIQSKTEKPQQLKAYAADNQLSKDVYRVKHYRVNNDYSKESVEQSMNGLVGMSGSIYWKSFGLINGSNNIARVKVYINRSMRNGQTKKAIFSYLLNRSTGYVRFEKLIVNGVELDSNSMMLEVLEMKLDQS